MKFDLQKFSGFYPFNPAMGQQMQTGVEGVEVDHAFIAHFQVAAASAEAGSATGIHAAITQTAAAQTITTGITQPKVPKNITIKGNAAGNAGDVVINGTDYAGAALSETLALNAATEVLGTKAFKTVTSIVVPAETHVGTDTVSIGFGEKLGLPFKLTHNTVIKTLLDNAVEATAPTVTVSATVLASNTADLNTALNGAKIVDIYLMV